MFPLLFLNNPVSTQPVSFLSCKLNPGTLLLKTGRGWYGTQVQLFAAWKANIQETSVVGKGTAALFRRPATWEDGGLMSQNQPPNCWLGDKGFKGEFQGCTGGGAMCRRAQSAPIIINNKLVVWCSGQHHLDLLL